jgi:hypothetical protein
MTKLEQLRERQDVVEAEDMGEGRFKVIDDVADELEGTFEECVRWLDAGLSDD